MGAKDRSLPRSRLEHVFEHGRCILHRHHAPLGLRLEILRCLVETPKRSARSVGARPFEVAMVTGNPEAKRLHGKVVRAPCRGAGTPRFLGPRGTRAVTDRARSARNALSIQGQGMYVDGTPLTQAAWREGLMDSPPGQSARQTVLLVDDDPMLRPILARALVAGGYAVLTAADGEEALVLASTLNGQLRLVVTDIRMPGMDGVELAAHLARLDSALPVLFISGFAAKTEIPGPFLQKPFAPRAFLEQVERMLNSSVPHS